MPKGNLLRDTTRRSRQAPDLAMVIAYGTDAECDSHCQLPEHEIPKCRKGNFSAAGSSREKNSLASHRLWLDAEKPPLGGQRVGPKDINLLEPLVNHVNTAIFIDVYAGGKHVAGGSISF